MPWSQIFEDDEKPLVTRFAEDFIQHLGKGDYNQISSFMDRSTLTRIKGEWLNCLNRKGKFSHIVGSKIGGKNAGNGIVVRVSVNFESGRKKALVTVNKSNSRYTIFDCQFSA